jgi:hypothetical protein
MSRSIMRTRSQKSYAVVRHKLRPGKSRQEACGRRQVLGSGRFYNRDDVRPARKRRRLRAFYLHVDGPGEISHPLRLIQIPPARYDGTVSPKVRSHSSLGCHVRHEIRTAADNAQASYSLARAVLCLSGKRFSVSPLIGMRRMLFGTLLNHRKTQTQ